jgi:hypothetical protein
VDFTDKTTMEHPGFADREAYRKWGDARLKWVDWLEKRHPPQCYFCKGRHAHNPNCYAVRWAFQLKMPFGKHKGKPLGEVPKDYLQWLLRKADRMDSDTREAVEIVLKQ